MSKKEARQQLIQAQALIVELRKKANNYQTRLNKASYDVEVIENHIEILNSQINGYSKELEIRSKYPDRKSQLLDISDEEIQELIEADKALVEQKKQQLEAYKQYCERMAQENDELQNQISEIEAPILNDPEFVAYYNNYKVEAYTKVAKSEERKAEESRVKIDRLNKLEEKVNTDSEFKAKYMAKLHYEKEVREAFKALVNSKTKNGHNTKYTNLHAEIKTLKTRLSSNELSPEERNTLTAQLEAKEAKFKMLVKEEVASDKDEENKNQAALRYNKAFANYNQAKAELDAYNTKHGLSNDVAKAMEYVDTAEMWRAADEGFEFSAIVNPLREEATAKYNENAKKAQVYRRAIENIKFEKNKVKIDRNQVEEYKASFERQNDEYDDKREIMDGEYETLDDEKEDDEYYKKEVKTTGIRGLFNRFKAWLRNRKVKRLESGKYERDEDEEYDENDGYVPLDADTNKETKVKPSQNRTTQKQNDFRESLKSGNSYNKSEKFDFVKEQLEKDAKADIAKAEASLRDDER